MGGDGLDGAQGEHGAKAEGHVRGLDHFEDRHFQGLGQPLAAVGGIRGKAVPAARGELTIGVAKARGRAHRSVLEGRPVQISGTVQGGQHLAGEGAGGFQHGGHRVGVRGREELRQASEVRGFIKGEDEIANGRFVGHGSVLGGGWAI